MKKKNLFFYMAYVLNLFYIMQYRSALINLPSIITKLIVLLVYIFFLVKLLLDRYTFKRLLLCFLLSIFFLYLYYLTKVQYIFVAFLAIISMKDVEIKKILKIDIIFRGIILLIHFILFGIDYILYDTSIQDLIITTSKGTSAYLYFDNANVVSEYFFSLIMNILYLKDDLKFKDYLSSFSLMTIMFFITKSRTSYAVFIIFIILNIIKNKKILYIISKYSFLLFSIFLFYIIKYVSTGSNFYNLFNDVTSNRIKYSILSFRNTNLIMLPKSNEIIQKYIIDNFFVKCYVVYRIILLLIVFVVYLFAINKKDIKKNRLIISMNVYLLFEQVITNIGYNPFLLILTNDIVNKNKKENEGDNIEEG